MEHKEEVISVLKRVLEYEQGFKRVMRHSDIHKVKRLLDKLNTESKPKGS